MLRYQPLFARPQPMRRLWKPFVRVSPITLSPFAAMAWLAGCLVGLVETAAHGQAPSAQSVVVKVTLITHGEVNDTYFVLPLTPSAPATQLSVGNKNDVFALLTSWGATRLLLGLPGPYAVRCCASDTTANPAALARYNGSVARLESGKPATGSGAWWTGRRSRRGQNLAVTCFRATVKWCVCPRLTGQAYLAGTAVVEDIADLRPATKSEADAVLTHFTQESLPDFIRVKTSKGAQ